MLVETTFEKARLKSTNLYRTTADRACWLGAKNLDRLRLGNTILADRKVRQLLATRSRTTRNFQGADLRGAYLNEFDLADFNFKRADLGGATLKGANLQNTNLVEANLVGADLSLAQLTGACLEGWNIDATTVVSKVDCQYVFLLENPAASGSRQRRPHHPEKTFQPGDFEKLFKETLDELQLLIRNGIDPAAFRQAFQALRERYPALSADNISKVERKGPDVLLTLEVPPDLDKARAEQTFDNAYARGLAAGRTAGYLEAEEKFRDERQTLTDLLRTAVSQPITVNVDAKAMTGSQDNSQSIAAGGDLNINADRSVVNLRDLSGTVTNTIQQLPDPDPAADRPNLKALLGELQQAIDASDLSEKDKEKALKQLKKLGECGLEAQNAPTAQGIQDAAETAIDVLKGVVAVVPSLWECVRGSIAAIALCFGL